MSPAPGLPNRVVAHYIDGRRVRGFTLDFFPTQPTFHICASEKDAKDAGTLVRLSELKAVFFVADLDSVPHAPTAAPSGEHKVQPSMRGIVVRFKDGEALAGATCGYSPDRAGFFVQPLDPGTNNERVFVLRVATEIVRTLKPGETFAEVLAQTEPGKKA